MASDAEKKPARRVPLVIEDAFEPGDGLIVDEADPGEDNGFTFTAYETAEAVGTAIVRLDRAGVDRLVAFLTGGSL